MLPPPEVRRIGWRGNKRNTPYAIRVKEKI